jgi:hypothetical protein
MSQFEDYWENNGGDDQSAMHAAAMAWNFVTENHVDQFATHNTELMEKVVSLDLQLSIIRAGADRKQHRIESLQDVLKRVMAERSVPQVMLDEIMARVFYG